MIFSIIKDIINHELILRKFNKVFKLRGKTYKVRISQDIFEMINALVYLDIKNVKELQKRLQTSYGKKLDLYLNMGEKFKKVKK